MVKVKILLNHIKHTFHMVILNKMKIFLYYLELIHLKQF